MYVNTRLYDGNWNFKSASSPVNLIYSIRKTATDALGPTDYQRAPEHVNYPAHSILKNHDFCREVSMCDRRHDAISRLDRLLTRVKVLKWEKLAVAVADQIEIRG